VGDMEKSTRSGFSATGFCFGEEWEIKLKRRSLGLITVGLEKPDQGETGCRFEGLFFGHGRVILPAGTQLRWRHPFLRIYDHVLEVKSGPRLLRYRPTFFRFFRTETRVEVSPHAEEMDELPQLVLLSWFLRIHAEKRGRRVF
jgi:hypothetical protein